MTNHPILFNAEMIRAILTGHKTQTRRVIRFPSWISDPKDGQPTCLPIQGDGYCDTRAITKEDCWAWGRRMCGRGHTLWIRETFCLENTSDYHGDQIVPPGTPVQKHDDEPDGEFDTGPYWLIPHYRATEPDAAIMTGNQDCGDWEEEGTKWLPSIHMPHWASRIILLVKNVRVEQLQDISEADAMDEGCEPITPGQLTACSVGPYKHGFRSLWNSINENGWNENPWVWVVKFELKGGVR